jgi:tetratricopeptide (TPR) repeat protein
VFDTMETRFFSEGDELSAAPPTGDGWDEVTASIPRRRRKGTIAAWAAVAAAACAICGVLAFRHARRNAEPVSPANQVPTAVPADVAPTQATPVPAARQVEGAEAAEPAKLAEPAEVAPPHAAAGSLAAQPDSSAFDACKKAYDRHRGRDVLANCGRAFANDPRSAEIAVMLAKTEFDRGRFRQALDWAKKTVALDENQADAYVFLGGAEQASGHEAAAKTAYQRYLQLSPKGRYAADLRAVLGSL